MLFGAGRLCRSFKKITCSGAAVGPCFSNKNSPMTRFSERTKQFDFFDKQLGHPDWTGKTVLDFGGNIGGFLRGAGNRVEPENYWCLDLDKEVLERGQRAFLRTHFVFYNRYSFEFSRCRDFSAASSWGSSGGVS